MGCAWICFRGRQNLSRPRAKLCGAPTTASPLFGQAQSRPRATVVRRSGEGQTTSPVGTILVAHTGVPRGTKRNDWERYGTIGNDWERLGTAGNAGERPGTAGNVFSKAQNIHNAWCHIVLRDYTTPTDAWNATKRDLFRRRDIARGVKKGSKDPVFQFRPRHALPLANLAVRHITYFRRKVKEKIGNPRVGCADFPRRWVPWSIPMYIGIVVCSLPVWVDPGAPGLRPWRWNAPRIMWS
jgi:hypothetical protein